MAVFEHEIEKPQGSFVWYEIDCLRYYVAGIHPCNTQMEEKSRKGKEKRCEGRPWVNWVEGNYSLFPHNGLDKDWYCNSFHFSVKWSMCMGAVCCPVLYIWKWFCVWIVCAYGSMRICQWLQSEGEKEASGNLSYQRNEVRTKRNEQLWI